MSDLGSMQIMTTLIVALANEIVRLEARLEEFGGDQVLLERRVDQVEALAQDTESTVTQIERMVDL